MDLGPDPPEQGVDMNVGAIVAQMYSGDDHMDWDDGTTWVMLGLMAVAVLAVAGGIVWAIVGTTWSSRHTRTLEGSGMATPSARQLLDQRYARGEIDTADYDERRSRLD
jgi:putative membrane protein